MSRSMVNGFPDRTRVQLVYTERVSITSTTGAIGIYRFAGNDVYDPNVTGTGAQPINADVFTTQYNRCRVHGSRMQLSVRVPADGTIPFDIVLLPQNKTTNLTFEEFCGQPYAKMQEHVVYLVGPTVFETGIQSAKILGRTRAAFEGSDLTQSVTTTSPSDLWYWTIAAISTDRSTTGTMNAIVDITYDVEYFDRQVQALSLHHPRQCFPSPAEAAPITRDEIKRNNLSMQALTDLRAGDSKAAAPRWSDDEAPDDEEAIYSQFLAWKKSVGRPTVSKAVFVDDDRPHPRRPLAAGAGSSVGPLARLPGSSSTLDSSSTPAGSLSGVSTRLAGQPGAGLKDAS